MEISGELPHLPLKQMIDITKELPNFRFVMADIYHAALTGVNYQLAIPMLVHCHANFSATATVHVKCLRGITSFSQTIARAKTLSHLP